MICILFASLKADNKLYDHDSRKQNPEHGTGAGTPAWALPNRDESIKTTNKSSFEKKEKIECLVHRMNGENDFRGTRNAHFQQTRNGIRFI